MTLEPVAFKKSFSPSTMAVPICLPYGGPPPAGGFVGTHEHSSTSLAPIRITGEPMSLKSAIKGAFAPLSVEFVRWVFSTLKPRNSLPTVPVVVPRFTVTVPVTIIPEAVGPPTTGVPHGPAPAFMPADDVPAAPAVLPAAPAAELPPPPAAE